MNGWMPMSHALLTRIAMVSVELVVLAALVWALIAVFRIRTPRLCAMLWLVVLAKPILGLVIGAPLPVMDVPYGGGAMLTPEQRQAALNQILSATAETGDDVAKSAPANASVAKTVASAPAAATVAGKGFSVSISPARAVEAAWLAVVLGMIGYLAFDMRRLRRLVGASGPAPAGVQDIYNEVARELGIAAAPELRVSDALDSPALGGVLKPVVLLPRWIAEQAGREQIAWLVRHELMHFKQRDPLALAVRRVAEILFFFHPAVWWAGRKWEESMELACDRALLKTDDDAHSYAEQLYWVLEHKANRQRMLKAGLCATRTQIGKRIASLLSNPLRFPARMSGMALSGLVIIAMIGLTAGLGLHQASAEETSGIEQAIKTMAVASNVVVEKINIDQDGKIQVDGTAQDQPMVDAFIKKLRTSRRLQNVTSEITFYTGFGSDAKFKVTAQQVAETTSPLKQDVSDLASRTNRNLESTASAAFSYAMVTRTFPGTIADLIANNKGHANEMLDLFTGRDAKSTDTLKITYPDDYSKVFIYSVGPDGVDDHAAITYDPTNGTMSPGDIIQIRELKSWSPHIYKADDAELLKKLKSAAENLALTEGAIEAYYQRHDALPEDLSKLVGDETSMAQLPEDPFAPGQPIRYSLSADKQVATIYSIGPDGKDDGGKVEVGHRIKQGETPGGDISYQIKAECYVNRKKNLAEISNKCRDVLVAIREKTGRDNAMIHYIDASQVMGTMFTYHEEDLIKAALAQGWTENSKPLLTTIARFKPAFDEVRKGVELNYAVNDIGDCGPDTAVPNFLAAQQIARIMCVEGRYFESLKQYDKAIDDYLAVLKMSRDYGVPNCTLIGGLISVACQRFPLAQISRLAASGALDDDQLKGLAAQLKAVEATQGDFNQWLDGEIRSMDWVLDYARRDPDKLRAVYAKVMAHRKNATAEAEEIIKNVDRLTAEHKQWSDWEKAGFAMPYWQRNANGFNKAGYEKLVAGMHPLIKKVRPNFEEANVRYLHNAVRLGQARVVVALEQYRKGKGSYPDGLNALAPKFIEVVPTDPFSGQPLMYQLGGDGKYRLWSLGPDAINNGAAVSYDPTNGTTSGGDIGAGR
ncbi:MAG: M56 family metallopeptidase [Candidatus Sumerlaeia bacterium]